MKNIAIFASGTPDGGGTGLEKLLEKIKVGEINSGKISIVTNYPNGGVAKISDKYSDIVSNLLVQHNFPKRGENGEFSKENIEWIRKFYDNIVKKNNLDFIFLSGWMKLVLGIEPNKVVNIHPGPVSDEFRGFYGKKLYEKILNDYKSGKIKKSCVTMHYVTEEYDKGPVISQFPVEIKDSDTIQDLELRTKQI